MKDLRQLALELLEMFKKKTDKEEAEEEVEVIIMVIEVVEMNMIDLNSNQGKMLMIILKSNLIHLLGNINTRTSLDLHTKRLRLL
jgi:hypothetical protein